MAPAHKRKSDEMAEPTTPEASNTPAPKRMRITQTQKQALIDNLQLEITERVRQLRAQYALQCAGLRSRIERRINRIPMSMRSMTMQDLMEKHESKPAPPPKQELLKPAPAMNPPTAMRPPTRVTRKKKSSIVIAADPPQEHENAFNNDQSSNTQSAIAIAPKSNPKGAKRPGSRTGRGAGGVLSPRSHNSRTLPRSPIKGATAATITTSDCQMTVPAPASPSKPPISRPFSPLKPASPLKSAAIATTSAISSSVHTMLSTAKSTATRSGKASVATTASTRSQAQSTRAVSQASNHSVATNGTTTSSGTVVKSNTTRSIRGRAAAAVGKKTAASKATTTTTSTAQIKSKTGTTTRKAATSATTKKTAAAAAAAAATTGETATTTTGRRVLRKRNPV